MRAGSVEAVACPRCERPPVVSHDEVFCLVHGQVHEPVRAWEVQPIGEISREGRARVRQPTVGNLPVTAEEREWWRLEALGLPVPMPPDVAPPAKRPSTHTEYLQWVADRVAAGELVGVEVLCRELRIGRWYAEQVMGGSWPALVRRRAGG